MWCESVCSVAWIAKVNNKFGVISYMDGITIIASLKLDVVVVVVEEGKENNFWAVS